MVTDPQVKAQLRVELTCLLRIGKANRKRYDRLIRQQMCLREAARQAAR